MSAPNRSIVWAANDRAIAKKQRAVAVHNALCAAADASACTSQFAHKCKCAECVEVTRLDRLANEAANEATYAKRDAAEAQMIFA
jgi:hypothetical protein